MKNIRKIKIKIAVAVCLYAFSPLLAVAQLDLTSSALFQNFSSSTSKSILVAEADTGLTVFAKSDTEYVTPASLTKLLTAMVVLDANPKLKGNMVFLKEDLTVGSVAKLKVGYSYKISDLFKAMMVSSANDAATVLARSVKISKEEFVQRMNNLAGMLGASGAKFYDPAGLSTEAKASARDILQIAQAAFLNENISSASRLSEFSFKGTKGKYSVWHKSVATNKLLVENKLNIFAGKTGHLEESGYNFAAQFTAQNGKKYMVVLLGAPERALQFDEFRKIATVANAGQESELGRVAGASTSLLMMPKTINPQVQ